MVTSRSLLVIALLGSACATDSSDPDEIVVDEAEPGDDVGKADSFPIKFTVIAADVSLQRLEAAGIALITNPKQWSRGMGTTPPVDVDFTTEWVVFFGTGLQATDGFSAEITGLFEVRCTRQQIAARQCPTYANFGALQIDTRATVPGAGCVAALQRTTPHVVVKFTVPQQRPFSARWKADVRTSECASM